VAGAVALDVRPAADLGGVVPALPGVTDPAGRAALGAASWDAVAGLVAGGSDVGATLGDAWSPAGWSPAG
jgi:hypothetical protein